MGACETGQNLSKRPSRKQKIPERTQRRADDLQCQICHRGANAQQLAKHYDKKHLAMVRSSIRQSGIQVYCLLCNFQTISLNAHQMHLNLKHKYIEKYLKNRANATQTHEQIRLRIKKTKKSDFKLSTPDAKGKAVGEKDGHKYDVFIHNEEYTPLNFDQYKAEGDLIWRYIFDEFPKAEYFSVESEPGDKKIRSTGYIFVKSSFH